METKVNLPSAAPDNDQAIIEAAPPALTPEESLAESLNVPPLPSPEPTETATLPPEPDADEPLPMLTSPLVPTNAVPVLRDKSPDTTELPALLVDTDTHPELVSVPTPGEIGLDPPKADVLSPPSIATAPPLVLPSPETKVKLPALLVDRDTLPKLVSVPTPDDILIDPLKADVPTPPSIATSHPLGRVWTVVGGLIRE